MAKLGRWGTLRGISSNYRRRLKRVFQAFLAMAGAMPSADLPGFRQTRNRDSERKFPVEPQSKAQSPGRGQTLNQGLQICLPTIQCRLLYRRQSDYPSRLRFHLALPVHRLALPRRLTPLFW